MTTDDRSERGIEMTSAEVDRYLADSGHGTLSLAVDGEPYGVPMSFGYDGDQLYINALTFGAESRKASMIEANRTVCLTSYEIEGKHAWASVVVDGTLESVPEEETEHVDDVMDDTAWVPGLNPPPDPITSVDRYVLSIDRATGRKGSEYSLD